MSQINNLTCLVRVFLNLCNGRVETVFHAFQPETEYRMILPMMAKMTDGGDYCFFRLSLCTSIVYWSMMWLLLNMNIVRVPLAPHEDNIRWYNVAVPAMAADIISSCNGDDR